MADVSVATYRCVKKSQCRSGFDMGSDKAVVIAVGTSVDVLERRYNDAGTLRLKIAQGWVSEKTGAGVLCFQMVSETAPIGAATPAAADAAAESQDGEPTAYRCVKKSQIRIGCELDSDKAGILAVGEEIQVVTTAVINTDNKGVPGAVCLQAIAWAPPVDPPAPSQPLPQQNAAGKEERREKAATTATAAAPEQEQQDAAAREEEGQEEAATTAAVAASAPEEQDAAAGQEEGQEEAATTAAAAASAPEQQKQAVASTSPTEVPAAEPVAVDCPYKSAKCVKKSQARAGFDMTSDKAGVIAVGTVLDVIETKKNDAGTLRIRFNGGWVSEHAGNGATCFELIRHELGAPPACKAPVPEPEPAPEPAPEPEPPLVLTVTEEDITPGEYKCIHAAIIREGHAMNTAKAGVLDAGERIDVLETHTLDTGLVRCRFKDGWVSAQLHGGERIFERTVEISGETVKCGDCTLSKEAYSICMKMARTSRLKNKAIIMKINLKEKEIVLVDELDDVTPEDIAEEFEDVPFEPRYCMYMYEYKRDDGRVTYPLCFIWYNPSGCDVHLNMIYGQTTEALVTLLKASKTFNVQNVEELTSEWLRTEVQKGSGVK